MIEIKLKESLKNQGFTEGEVNLLQEMSEKDNKPLITLLEELKKRFYAGLFLSALMTIVLIISIINHDNGHLIGILVAAIIVYSSVFFIIPMKFGYKSMKYLKTRSNIS